MRKQLILVGLLFSLVVVGPFGPIPWVHSADLSLGFTNLAITIHPENVQIPTHIASPTEFVSRVTIPTYQDTTVLRQSGYHSDGAAHMSDGFIFNIASTIPLFRIHPADQEDLGIGFQADFMIPFVTDKDWIAMSMEFVINLGITVSFHPSFAIGVSRKHICSHLLDRALFTDGLGFLGTSSSDIDPQHTSMAIRDSIVFSFHTSPEKLLFPDQEFVETSFYFDYGYSLPGGDPFSPARYTRPSFRSSRYYQYGAQLMLHMVLGRADFGSLAAGCNFSFYENSGYTPNTSYSIGYVLPVSSANRKLMVEYSFYDGRAVMEEYYGQRERYTSIGLKITR
jgi:hypothetical protein